MKTLDAVLDADPEFFTRHPVGEIVGVVITQTGTRRAARSSRSSSSSPSSLLMAALRGDPLRDLRAAHADHARLRGAGLGGGEANIRRIRDYGDRVGADQPGDDGQDRRALRA